MDDSISRAAAIDALKSAKGKDPFGRYDLQNIGLDWGVSAIEKLPSIQPRRGKYKAVVCDGVDLLACSECGYTGAFWSYNFCPNCGSYNGGEDEQN